MRTQTLPGLIIWKARWKKCITWSRKCSYNDKKAGGKVMGKNNGKSAIAPVMCGTRAFEMKSRSPSARKTAPCHLGNSFRTKDRANPTKRFPQWGPRATHLLFTSHYHTYAFAPWALRPIPPSSPHFPPPTSPSSFLRLRAVGGALRALEKVKEKRRKKWRYFLWRKNTRAQRLKVSGRSVRQLKSYVESSPLDKILHDGASYCWC